MRDVFRSEQRGLIIDYSVVDLDNDLGQGAKGEMPMMS